MTTPPFDSDPPVDPPVGPSGESSDTPPAPPPTPPPPTPPPAIAPPPLPEGWYDDPFTDELERYWTGTSWTKQTRPRQLPPDPLPPADSWGSPAAPPSARGLGAPTIQAPAPPDGSALVIRDYLILSILSLIFCFWPLAIPAVYFAVRTNSAKRAGDLDAAMRYSDRARLFLMLSVVAGLLVGAYLAWVVLSEGSGALGM